MKTKQTRLPEWISVITVQTNISTVSVHGLAPATVSSLSHHRSLEAAVAQKPRGLLEDSEGRVNSGRDTNKLSSA